MTIHLYYSRPPFKYIIGALAHTLEEMGYKTETYQEVPEDKKGEFWIGIWNGCKSFPKNYIAYNFEPLHFGDWPRTCIPYLKAALEVWDYSTANVATLASHKINHHIFPTGYSPYYESCYEKNLAGVNFQEDIDVLIYATPTPRREAVVNNLRNSGLKITWLGRDKDDNPKTDPKRDHYIARAKMVLSIVHNEPRALGTNDFARLSYLIAVKKFFVCELVGDEIEAKWKPYIRIVPINQIEDYCRYYLENPGEKAEITKVAYQYAVRNFHMKDLLPIESVRKYYQPALI